MIIDHSFHRGDDKLPFNDGTSPGAINSLQILTERLIIRPIEVSDARDVFIAFTPKVAEFMTPPPAKELAETEAFLTGAVKDRGEGSDLQLVITDRTTGGFLGLIGLHSRFGSAAPEIGVWVKESAWGNGYGKEAVHALIDWAQKNMSFDHIVYPVAENNLKSRKIVEAYGVEPVSSRETTRSWAGNLTLVEYHIPFGATPKEQPTT